MTTLLLIHVVISTFYIYLSAVILSFVQSCDVTRRLLDEQMEKLDEWDEHELDEFALDDMDELGMETFVVSFVQMLGRIPHNDYHSQVRREAGWLDSCSQAIVESKYPERYITCIS